VFSRRTVDTTSKALHGSVTIADISERLQDEYGLAQGDVGVIWRGSVEGDRLKVLGRAGIKVQVREGGREARVLTVQVVRLQDNVEA
jgi:hypothetical protein